MTWLHSSLHYQTNAYIIHSFFQNTTENTISFAQFVLFLSQKNLIPCSPDILVNLYPMLQVNIKKMVYLELLDYCEFFNFLLEKSTDFTTITIIQPDIPRTIHIL